MKASVFELLLALVLALFTGLYKAGAWIRLKLKNAFSGDSERLNRKIGELQADRDSWIRACEVKSAQCNELHEKFEKLQHQKISADVKLGQRYENILPFMEAFPYKDDEIRGMYNPIDLIVFRDDEVVFVEVKTGVAQLSDKQRKIRDNIKAGRVRFEVHRMDENGVKIK